MANLSINTMHSIKGYIFDLDGTLVESKLNFQAIKQEVGCPFNIDLLSFVEQLEPINRRRVTQIIERHELADASNAMLLPGVHEFLKWLNKMKIPSALVTRNSPEATELKLKQNQLEFDIVLTRDDAVPKPAPDSLLSILEQWKLKAEHTVYIGDYLYDIQAARNASMLSYLYAPKVVPAFASQADLIFHCWHDLLAEITRLKETSNEEPI